MLLPLTENNLHSVASLCLSNPDMNAIVACKQHRDVHTVFRELERAVTFAQLVMLSQVRRSSAPKNSVVLNNGSNIKVVCPDRRSIGCRANIIVYDNRISKDVIDDILAPMQINYRLQQRGDTY